MDTTLVYQLRCRFGLSHLTDEQILALPSKHLDAMIARLGETLDVFMGQPYTPTFAQVHNLPGWPLLSR